MRTVSISLSARILYELSKKPCVIGELSKLSFEPINVIGARLSELKKANMIYKEKGKWYLRHLSNNE